MEKKQAMKQLSELQKKAREMRLAAEEWGSEWQTLIAILMSARTRDETTIKVAERLFKKYKTTATLATANATEVSAIIRSVNFFRNKTKSVIGCAKMLTKEFGGEVPRDIGTLMMLPGVGRKTANVFLSEVGKDAIGVDTHVSYISQKLGWTVYKDPRKIEEDLRNLFPRAEWSRVNRVCVRFGKTHQSRREKNAILEEIKNKKYSPSGQAPRYYRNSLRSSLYADKPCSIGLY